MVIQIPLGMVRKAMLEVTTTTKILLVFPSMWFVSKLKSYPDTVIIF